MGEAEGTGAGGWGWDRETRVKTRCWSRVDRAPRA